MAPSQEMSDRDLVRACRSGDAAAWETLIRRYRRLIYSIPVGCRLPPDRADDVFQRVAVKLLEHIATIRDADRLPVWLAVTARREALTLLRSEGRFRPLDPEDEGTDAGAVAPEILSNLETVEREHGVARAFDRIGEPCRGLLSALYVEDPTPSYEEIARRTGRPIGSLGPTRSRCLAKLKKLYLGDVSGRSSKPLS